MKKTFESMDKLQVDLDEPNAVKVALETKAKTIEDHVTELQWQVQARQAKAIEKQATNDRVTELKHELKDTMAHSGEMCIEGQDFVKKELTKHFLIEDFSQIDKIFHDDDDKQKEEERQEDENNPSSLTSTRNHVNIDDGVGETREEEIEENPHVL